MLFGWRKCNVHIFVFVSLSVGVAARRMLVPSFVACLGCAPNTGTTGHSHQIVPQGTAGTGRITKFTNTDVVAAASNTIVIQQPQTAPYLQTQLRPSAAITRTIDRTAAASQKSQTKW